MSAADVARFRDQARSWLERNAGRYAAGTGQRAPDAGGATGRAAQVAEAREFQARLYESGFAGITVAEEFGGRGLTDDHELAFESEAARYRLPSALLGVSVNIIGGTILAFGSDQQRVRHMPRILAGHEVFVQLLTEPSGGSDLASLLTRADADGEVFRLTGQKTWSTGAAEADFALCPARTDWKAPKHRGITMFIVDLKAPGVDIREIRQIDGAADFCEEFLTDVVIPAANVLGSVNGGWQVVRGLLEIEHKWSGRHNTGRREIGTAASLLELAASRRLLTDPAVRREIAALHIRIRGHAALTARLARQMADGRAEPGMGGLLKLSSDELTQTRAELGLRLAGPAALGWADGSPAGRFAHDFLNSRSASIAGGSDEIQRNNVGERGLGLPREPSVDTGVPFDQVPHN